LVRSKLEFLDLLGMKKDFKIFLV